MLQPIYHKTDDRIRAHVFIYMLAYHLQWHMQQRLAPLFASDGKGKGCKWTYSSVMERLKQNTFNPVRMAKVKFEKLAVPTERSAEDLGPAGRKALSNVAILMKSKIV
ncbi:MAG: hypothetical protein GX456_17865 [Verrucomicrobia bacterium]|nr:hypothetical protein [Verrucomicrobiota bacterium]